ncbi:lipase family protein [Pseudoalteromonas sp. BSi20495]|uniref:lipase family protein n=1 Tax=Pseudoalteromonas sp. BSi20495 TaxID=386429 RepID=UPI0002315996|nr:lipase family protein [Pseudoalteromonas sp. BSi20495]GAA77610.1 predicted lipase [Pseudoalteromonas sp. BSi20495]
MSTLSPVICAELATISYDIHKPTKRGRYLLETSATLKSLFSFDLSNGPIKGISGGAMAHATGHQTGFVLVGKGTSPAGRMNPFKNDLVLAIRGTASIYDASTDCRANISVCDGGHSVHAGFNTLFETLKLQLAPLLRELKPNATVHCVGHSLGGAVASLVADWAKRRFSSDVKLYTFGAPKVGLTNFALSTTNALEPKNIFRCVNGGDVVPMVPFWPFMQAPYNAPEYKMDNNQIIAPWHHLMKYYTRNSQKQSWDSINKRVTFNPFKRVTLDITHATQVQPSIYWMNRLSEALMTVLRQAKLGTLNALQSGTANGLSLYDKIAMILANNNFHTVDLTGPINGLLACMLAFAGYARTKIKELSAEFIKWVFEKTLKMVNRIAQKALSAVD